MNKVLGVLVCVTAIALIAGCTKDNPVSLEEYDLFAYVGYDSLGAKEAAGLLVLSKDRTSGSWELKAAGDQPADGLSPGEGQLAGTPSDTSLVVELHPGVCDYSYRLTGKIENGIFSGTWGYYGFAGLMSRGTFTAKSLFSGK